MIRLLILTQYTNDATYEYRLAPLFYIDHPRIKVIRKKYEGDITFSFFENCTHLILERPSGWHDLDVIKLAKQRGLMVITDWDDDVIHLPIYNPMFHHYEGAKKTILECISLSDEVWVSTPNLKRAFMLFNRNIMVLPNSHNDFLQPVSAKKAFDRTGKKIFFRGGNSHEADVYENSEKWVKIIKKNKKWSFYFVGCRFIWMEQRCGQNYQPVSNMPLMQYFEFMAKGNPQILFHPLSNNIFNKSKSNIAWLEGTYVGAAVFGNKTLTEYNKESIIPIEDLGSQWDLDFLEQKNKDAWEEICDTVLLSKTNDKRVERLLNL